MTTKRHRWFGILGRAFGWGLAAMAMACVLAFGGVVFAWTRLARALPDLRGWHRDAPASEFRAADERDGYSLDDYLRQEDGVFAELDALVVGAWASEEVGRFCRFRAESICNPATILERNWNRSFVLEAERPVGAALLVHGLSDSPYSLRSLGASLHAAGYTVVGLRVPGHGTCPKALAEVDVDDWAAALRVAARGVRNRVPKDLPFVMVGYSNGGALCVDYTAAALASSADLPMPSALVLISPMIGITPVAEFTTLAPVVAWISGEEKLAWSGIEPEIDPFKYSSWPTNASLQAYRITERVDERLAALAASGRMSAFPPLLAVQSIADSTVLAHRTIDGLMDRLTPGDSELLLFDVRRDALMDGLLHTGFEEAIRPRLDRLDRPFGLTLVTQRSADSDTMVARTYRTGGDEVEEVIDAVWPAGVFSLSHVALPIPTNDPVYGLGDDDAPAILPLGTLAARGESGVLALSPSLLMRMRYNPFYGWTEARILRWLHDRPR
jgi:alpha-beta hydrolase superfamily lysophospholipase